MNEASKRGRANKRTGYYYEKQLEKLFNGWGCECWRTPLSGAIKKEGLDGDMRVSVYGRIRKVENKKREVGFERFYKFVANGKAIIIEGFCALVSQEVFYGLINARKPKTVIAVQDKQFKGLHDFFEQDNADIVTMVSPRQPFIFALCLPLWDELYLNCYDEDVA